MNTREMIAFIRSKTNKWTAAELEAMDYQTLEQRFLQFPVNILNIFVEADVDRRAATRSPDGSQHPHRRNVPDCKPH